MNNPFQKTLERYLDIRGATLRPNTLRYYRATIRFLIEFLRIHFPELDSLADLRRPHIERWLQNLAKLQPPYRNSTRRLRIRTVRRFLEDIQEWDWPESPPPGLIRRDDFPPDQKYLPKPLTPEIDDVLMGGLRKGNGLISLGLILARRTGLRIGELIRLELDCLIESAEGRFSIRVPLGKIRSERVIPVDRETADIIRVIQKMHGRRSPTIDPETGRTVEILFCNSKNSFIERTVFGRRLKAVAKSVGITQNVYPHRLRHTYATEMLRNGVSLPGVMKLLGHKTLKMTLRYVEITNEDLGRDYLRAIENAHRQYAKLKSTSGAQPADHGEPLDAIIDAFDQLVARIQNVRFDHPNQNHRKKLQRLVERLRRAQSDLQELMK